MLCFVFGAGTLFAFYLFMPPPPPTLPILQAEVNVFTFEPCMSATTGHKRGQAKHKHVCVCYFGVESYGTA